MTQVPIWLVGVYAKIGRAKEHIGELDAEIRRFEKSTPYIVQPRLEPTSGDTLFVLRVREEVPLRCNSIGGDCIHNLRSSLDYLARQLVLVNDGTPTKQTAFPIFDSAEKFETGALGQIKGASKEAVALIKRLKPYRGGNDWLWRLHRLDIADKHREFITAEMAHEDVTIDMSIGMRKAAREAGFDWADRIPSTAIGIRPANRQYPLVDGTVLYRIPAGVDPTEVDMDPKFTLQISFGKSEGLEGEAVFPALHQLVGAVEDTVNLFRPVFTSTDRG